jgi:hypothetical protein
MPTTQLNCTLALPPCPSLTLALALYVPAVFAVPLITPVVVLMVSPGGNPEAE